MKKVDFFILLLILTVGLIFRLYKINIPLADLHSWRQADTAAVGRNFLKFGFNLLQPRFDDLSSNQSSAGLENPQGLRFVEFPLYNAFFAYLAKTFPKLSLEIWGRLTTAFFSLIIIAIIYYLVFKEAGRVATMTSSLVYAVFPFFVFFSRVILPETTALALAFISIFFLYLFANIKSKSGHLLFYFLSLSSLAVSLLVKPTTAFFAVALLYLFYRKYGLSFIKKISLYLFFLLSVVPFILWRLYIRNFPEGVPPADWLITSVNTYQGLKPIFFRPAFFRWIFFERINNLILGGYLTFFLILGIFTKPKKYFLHAIFLSSLLYLLIFQGGNVQHEYYQTLILPSIAIFIGLGTAFILENRKLFIHPFFTYSVTLFVFMLSFFFSFYKVRDFYHYPPELPPIANIIATLTAPDDKIVTDRMGDTTLLYLANRRGAPSIYKSPDELKKIGYRYLVTLNPGEIKQLKSTAKYKIVFENDQFALFKL